MARPEYANPTYQRHRRQLLADNPPCSWPDCTEPATTIDHIVPISKGGTAELSNLRPMCNHHNASRGNSNDGPYTAGW